MAKNFHLRVHLRPDGLSLQCVEECEIADKLRVIQYSDSLTFSLIDTRTENFNKNVPGVCDALSEQGKKYMVQIKEFSFFSGWAMFAQETETMERLKGITQHHTLTHRYESFFFVLSSFKAT